MLSIRPVLSLLLLLVGGADAGATTTLGDAGVDGVVDAAVEAWARREGSSLQAELDGLEAARRVAGTPVSLSTATRLGSTTNQEVVATLQAPIGLGIRARRSWSSRAMALRAGGEADRLMFIEQVLATWSHWAASEELVVHLDSWSLEVEGTLVPLDAAVEEGVAAPLDAEDLRAELATVRAEAAAVRAEATRAKAELASLLGALDGQSPLPEGELHLHDFDVASMANPWRPLVVRASESSTVRAARARSGALTAEAADQAAWRPVLEAGVAFADGNGPFEPLATVAISAPFRPTQLARARETRAMALAESHRVRWLAERVEGSWQAEAAGFDADQDRIARLDREVVVPLARRLERLEAAFADGLISADRVIRARRDHHEAEHERLLLAADLLASTARAEGVRRYLETP